MTEAAKGFYAGMYTNNVIHAIREYVHDRRNAGGYSDTDICNCLYSMLHVAMHMENLPDKGR